MLETSSQFPNIRNERILLEEWIIVAKNGIFKFIINRRNINFQ